MIKRVKLYELLDSPVSYNIIRQNDYTLKAEFTVGNILYEFIAKSIDGNTFTITFEIYGGDISITGTGNAPIVFSTVYSLLKYFIENYNPKMFYFDAKEPSREKLYKIFSLKITKEFKNYEVKINKSSDDTEFLFYRR